MTIVVFQGVFYPLTPFDSFRNIAQDYLQYIDEATLQKYQNDEKLSFFDEVQITHALNLSKVKQIDSDIGFYSGFSMGIYSALVAANVLEVEESFSLLKKRAKIFMAAIGHEWDVYACVGLAIDDVKNFTKQYPGQAYISNSMPLRYSPN